jgi:hypothetical protein
MRASMKRSWRSLMIRHYIGWCAGTMDQSEHEEELKELKASLQDTQPVGALVSACR